MKLPKGLENNKSKFIMGYEITPIYYEAKWSNLKICPEFLSGSYKHWFRIIKWIWWGLIIEKDEK